jgi:CheY-like chemotaxis protein
MQPAKSSPPKTCLIVDDEPLVRMELANIVRDCGFEAWEAASTAEALSLLEADAKRVTDLITDINMPGTRNGMVLANHVRHVWPHINIVVVSAVRCPLNGELPEKVPFLPKPVHGPQLVKMINGFESDLQSLN